MILENPKRSVWFSILMSAAGAALGPFLDSYHSAFGVLQYRHPITVQLWGSQEYPGLTTAWWVPELFGLAGLLIGWLYVMLDVVPLGMNGAFSDSKNPSVPKILLGISFFTFQYWLSGLLFRLEITRTIILVIMSLLAAAGFSILDRSKSGFIVSTATALGGPLIEAGLIFLTRKGWFEYGYQYLDLGETGLFPLWIIPVYFLGGPAVGNLARGVWKFLSPGRGQL